MITLRVKLAFFMENHFLFQRMNDKAWLLRSDIKIGILTTCVPH